MVSVPQKDGNLPPHLVKPEQSEGLPGPGPLCTVYLITTTWCNLSPASSFHNHTLQRLQGSDWWGTGRRYRVWMKQTRGWVDLEMLSSQKSFKNPLANDKDKSRQKAKFCIFFSIFRRWLMKSISKWRSKFLKQEALFPMAGFLP